MRAVGYFRESAHLGQTLAQQNKAFLEFCDRQGYDVAGTFADATSNGHAHGFRQLVAFLRENDRGFVIVVVPTIRALGSQTGDAALRYFQLEGLGARVAMISGEASATDAIVEAWTADDAGTAGVGNRVRAAMRRKAVKGEVLGRPPYGYKVGNRRRLELVPEEAVVVRYIFRLYLHEGKGIRLIARRLNEEALKTRRGGNWSMVSIRDILRNRAYLGTYSRFGVRVPGSHPSLVSVVDFNTVQDRLNARRTSFAPRVASEFLLSSIVFCGYCGNKLIGVSRKQTWKRQNGEQVSNSYRYYQCESRTNQSVCAYHTRRAEELEDKVRAEIAVSISDGLTACAESDGIERGEDIDRLRTRGRSIERRLEGYVGAAARGQLTKEKMHQLSLAAAADRLAVDDAVEAAERRIEDQVSAVERSRLRDRDLRAMLESWDSLDFTARQSGLREAILKITVSDESLQLTFRS